MGQGVVDGVIPGISGAIQTDRPHPGFLQLFKRSSDVHDFRDAYMRDGTGRRLRRGPSQSRRPSALPDDPIDAGGISGPQDGADVLWVFDAIQDNDQRHVGGRANEVGDAIGLGFLDLSNHALVHSPAGIALERVDRHVTDRHPAFPGEFHHVCDPAAGAPRDADFPDAPRTKRLQDGIDTEDDRPSA